MDHSPIKQTFDSENQLAQLERASKISYNCEVWLQNIVKCGKYSPVCEFCILLYYARKSLTTMWELVTLFSHVIQKYTKFVIFTLLLYFRHFTVFYNQTEQFH